MIGSESAREMLESYRNDRRQAVAEELAFAFNPLELSYWQAWVTERPERWPDDKALPDAVARQVADLAPLRRLAEVRELYLDGVAATDLTPLAGLTGLRTLSLDNTAVADLTPLAGLSSLRHLALDNTAVTDLTPLAALAGLQVLFLENTPIVDLTPVKQIEGLSIYGP
jgi:hypothetical protein